MENQNIELKEIAALDKIKKTAMAFANTSGGRIVIGVADDGTVVGVENLDATQLQVRDTIRNALKPDLTIFMKLEAQVRDDKEIIVVIIERGTSRPYYIAEKGLKPSGVYIRVNNGNVPATEEWIRQAIKETDGDKFEKSRSLEQSLTFESAKIEFDEKSIKFGDAQKESLGLISEGQFTNLALLLSDQCEHTTKVAVFEGKSKGVFKSRKEFTGSLFKQLREIMDYLDYFNLVRAEIGRIRRVESRDYPVASIREALLNAQVHREYALSASTFINIFDDRIEFLTVGGLVSGVTIDAIKSGVSHTRNEGLSNIYYRLELVEAYGTGIMRIMDDYATCKAKPVIEVTDSSFMITLPNMRVANGNGVDEDNQETEVFRIIERDGKVTTETLAEALGLGSTRCYNILKQMQADGKIKSVKNGRKIEYTL